MMKLTMLGTGNALVTDCYNTCFVLEDDEREEDGRYFLVDGGGGNTVLHQLKQAGIDWMKIHEVFVTHKHIDHLMGVIWMTRMFCQFMSQGKYEGDAVIYGHAEVIDIIDRMAHELLAEKSARMIGKRLHLVKVADGETRSVIGHDVTFFDIGSTKARQFGSTMNYDADKKLVCCGDEPYNDCEERYVRGCDWMLHEAFCLHSQAEIFHPYEKHHSTVMDACTLAEQLAVPNLLLYHTEDRSLARRRELYTAEGSRYYHGNLVVPEDLEVITL